MCSGVYFVRKYITSSAMILGGKKKQKGIILILQDFSMSIWSQVNDRCKTVANNRQTKRQDDDCYNNEQFPTP